MIKKVNLFLKRFADILGSGLGLLICSPFLLLAILLIKITMPGPAFFKQERVGKNGKLFAILKLRTMKVNCEAEKNHDSSLDEERMTVLGRFLRRIKLDELPQLINVFIGDMSLVGPRPTLEEQVLEYNDYQKQRLLMRPGMTGLAQVNGNASIAWSERIHYDVQYINGFNILMDIRILCKTVAVVIVGEDKFADDSKRGER